jgi:hypothetical protein
LASVDWEKKSQQIGDFVRQKTFEVYGDSSLYGGANYKYTSENRKS